MATWVIISGSPYGAGKCTTIAHQIADALERSDSSTKVQVFSCDASTVHGCIGCDRCKDNFTCIYQDAEQDILTALDDADAVLVISPVYFAGVPSQFKAVLDRFQPYFWKRHKLIAAGDPLPPKRALYCALVGEGGDPYGAEPAFATIASPFALADFALVHQQAFIKTDQNAILSTLLPDILEADRTISQTETQPNDQEAQ